MSAWQSKSLIAETSAGSARSRQRRCPLSTIITRKRTGQNPPISVYRGVYGNVCFEKAAKVLREAAMGANRRTDGSPNTEREAVRPLYFRVLGEVECILDINAKVADSALDFCVTKQYLDRAQIAGRLVDDRHLRSP